MAVGRKLADALRIGMGIFVFCASANCAPVDGDQEADTLFAIAERAEPEGLPDHSLHDRDPAMGDAPTHDMPHDVLGDASTDVPHDMPHDVLGDAPTDLPHDMPHDVSTDGPHDMQGHAPGDMPMDLMPHVDESAIPVGNAGRSAVMLKPTGEQPSSSPDGVGSFRNVCQFSHMNFDDPIVYPGKERATHLHAYFGNTLTDASSTAESLRSTGNSTCRGGTANRSAYWVPALLDDKGRPQVPADSHFYYKSGYEGIAPATIKRFPQGLRMIAGSAKAKEAQPHAYWGCFENYIGRTATIPSCPVGEHVLMTVDFPQCWNGKDLDSSDHKSHMAYPVNGACPDTHPVAIPEIKFGILYKVPPGGMAGWRLASDMYDANLPGGYSVHGDWFEGWDPAVSQAFVEQCTSRPVDCHSHLLGDGREITY